MARHLLLFLALPGCVVGDAATDNPFEVPTELTTLEGQVLDYVAGEAVGEVELETLGLAPERAGAADVGGGFALDVPIASAFYVRTAATATHRPTISEVVMRGEGTTATIDIVSEADIRRQHTTAGLEVEPDTSAVIVEITSFDGAPLDPLHRANVSLVSLESEALIAVDPYVFAATGDIDPALSESAPGPRARFAFLNVEVGTHALVVACPDCEPASETSVPLAAAPGVTVVRAILPAPQGPPPTSFEAIAPRLARGVDGGLGCASCHSAGQTPPAMDGDPAAVRAALLAIPGLVTPEAPDASRLLSKPLYELPADHPNATFLSTDDPDYQAIRAWIAAGAL